MKTEEMSCTPKFLLEYYKRDDKLWPRSKHRGYEVQAFCEFNFFNKKSMFYFVFNSYTLGRPKENAYYLTTVTIFSWLIPKVFQKANVIQHNLVYLNLNFGQK